MNSNTLNGIAGISRHTPTERLDYEDSLKAYRDLKNVLDTAELKGLKKGMKKGLEKGREEGMKKGREEGIKKGREEGATEAAIKIAKAMLASGMNIEQIAKLTGLTPDEIRSL